MAIIRWNPLRDMTAWHPVDDLTNEMFNVQREFDRIFGHFRSGVVDEAPASPWLPAVDIVENDNDYIVHVELPGVNKNDVKITVHNNVLTIRGEKKQEKETNEKSLHRVERCYGAFQRSFALPSFVRNDKIEAAYNEGVLTISLPKAEEAKPKEIEVKVK